MKHNFLSEIYVKIYVLMANGHSQPVTKSYRPSYDKPNFHYDLFLGGAVNIEFWQFKDLSLPGRAIHPLNSYRSQAGSDTGK
jgi:hypothetical protein